MTQEEAKEILISTLRDINSDSEGFECTTEQFTEAMLIAIEELSRPSLPSNMNEAAKESAERWRKNSDGSESRELFFQPYIRGFKAGAKWMAEQGETFNGFMSVSGKRSLIAIEGSSQNFKFGDNVIVQIRKKH